MRTIANCPHWRRLIERLPCSWMQLMLWAVIMERYDYVCRKSCSKYSSCIALFYIVSLFAYVLGSNVPLWSLVSACIKVASVPNTSDSGTNQQVARLQERLEGLERKKEDLKVSSVGLDKMCLLSVLHVCLFAVLTVCLPVILVQASILSGSSAEPVNTLVSWNE